MVGEGCQLLNSPLYTEWRDKPARVAGFPAWGSCPWRPGVKLLTSTYRLVVMLVKKRSLLSWNCVVNILAFYGEKYVTSGKVA